MNLTQEELDELENCKSEVEWDTACAKIKSVRDGHYPSDWWAKVKLSGLGTRVLARWGADYEISRIVYPTRAE